MKGIKLHILFWTCYFAFGYFSDLIIYSEHSVLVELILFSTHNLYLFYGLYYFLSNFSAHSRKDLFISFFRFLAVVSFFFVLRYFGRYYLLPRLFGASYGNMEIKQWATVGVIWVINYFFFASAYFYFVSSVAKQKSLLQLTQDRLIKEKEHLELKNTLLKAQINPHFLYNTLNLLYAKSLPLSQELSESIMKLSDIMRYSMQSHDEEGLVLLDDEVNNMTNLIDLAKLRFSNRIYVGITVDGDLDGMKIIPFALITLLENVLKHGLLTDSNSPAILRLEVSKGRHIRFHTWNRNRQGPKELSTSIGLSNTIQRLKNVYGEDFDFGTINAGDIYQTDLFIKIR